MSRSLFKIQQGVLVKYLGEEEHVTIPEGVVEIGKNAFIFKSNLKIIDIPNSLIKIGECAFQGCSSLETLKWNDNIQVIDKDAFLGCDSLAEFFIPSSLTKLHPGALRICLRLHSIRVASENQKFSSIDGVLFSKDQSELIRYPQNKEWNPLTIPQSVVSIGSYAFSDCMRIQNISIPQNIKIIKDNAFCFCNNLKEIHFPLNLSIIGERAFFGCENISSIKIPNSVTDIKYAAFSVCRSLCEIQLPFGIKRIGTAAFSYTGLLSITLPDSITEIGHGAFMGCEKLRDIHISDNNSFYCVEDGVLFSKNKKELLAYTNGRKNKNFTVPYGVEKICTGAFAEAAIETIQLPSSLRYIEDSAFSGCSHLKNISIPQGVKEIENEALAYCDSLTSVFLPKSIKYMGEAVFIGSNYLDTIFCEHKEQPDTWDDSWNAFEYEPDVIWGCSDRTGCSFQEDSNFVVPNEKKQRFL